MKKRPKSVTVLYDPVYREVTPLDDQYEGAGLIEETARLFDLPDWGPVMRVTLRFSREGRFSIRSRWSASDYLHVVDTWDRSRTAVICKQGWIDITGLDFRSGRFDITMVPVGQWQATHGRTPRPSWSGL